jgi:imidazolonepropionase-like amidohydrolase
VVNLLDKTGTLEAGKWADVIVVDGNPLDDLRIMSKVSLVFKEGTMHRPDQLAAATGKNPL